MWKIDNHNLLDWILAFIKCLDVKDDENRDKSLSWGFSHIRYSVEPVLTGLTVAHWTNNRASSSYFFLFFSAYSYFSYFFLAISSYLSYFWAILHVTFILYISFQGFLFNFSFFLSGAHQLFLNIFQPHFLWHFLYT